MKRILFVDDEPALLDGLRGRLRNLRSRWDMVFVENGARALAEMEMHLGFNAIRTLAMSVEVFSMWKRNSVLDGTLQPELLQDRAHRVAGAARALSPTTAMGDDALLAGLFHNIGYWVMLQECPQQVALALQAARSQGMPLHEAERQIIGASHAQIGAYLLGLWGLPYSVIEAVAFQHSPQRVGQTHFDVLAALVVAQRLVPADAVVADVTERPDITIDAEYLRTLQAPFDWNEAQARVAQTAPVRRFRRSEAGTIVE